ncbi:DUF4352 domain-containing protein [Agrococcus jejuensis]|uniref:DUF4352 domain-containing protein n=1 Tax=Agrococcus jejuensis TaxID=399736 RepID=A0A1G8C6N3_9MICO|nr:DUF4352 domain-containing protein [Agrococcus jejuensis]SDH41018.1 protein of unknown function [Agrococcus jejuensis]
MHIASSTIRRSLAATIPIVVASLALVGCGGASSSSDTGAPAPAATDQATETTAPAEAAQPGVGEVVSSDGWDFTVVSVGAAQEAVGSGALSSPAQGVYVPVTVTIVNTSNEAQFLGSDAVTIVDANGAEYSADSVASVYDQSAIPLGDVNPGITLTGPVYFDVPDGTVPTSVTFTGGLFGGQTVTVTL